MAENQADEVAVPDGVFVRCPKVGFDLTAVSLCPACEAFRGLADRFPGAVDKPFGQRFLVLCAHEPVKREILTVAK